MIDLRKTVGYGYDEFWRFRGRYRVVKGGRASKKSKTTALWYIFHIMKIPQTNLLVVRKTYNSLRRSCFAELKWAISRLGVEDFWKITESPLEMTFKPTGQRIVFRGLDDPLKITSITAEVGTLCWLWLEEAYEISDEKDFNTLDESIRGAGSTVGTPGIFKQITLTFNPWSGGHWLKKRFFDTPDSGDKLALTTTYLCNEWLDAADHALFYRMKTENPARYKVAGLGDWGMSDGLIFKNFEVKDFSCEPLRKGINPFNAELPTTATGARLAGTAVSKPAAYKFSAGLDFGYMADPTAFCAVFVSQNEIFVTDELYDYHLTNREIYSRICRKGYMKERIFADSAEPKSIDELRGLGLSRIEKARKGADSINFGIQLIAGHKLYIHPRCENFIKEISSYARSENGGGSQKYSGCDHLMDALRYAVTGAVRQSAFEF